MHVELSIHFKLKEGQDKGGEFLHLSLIACLCIYQGHER